MRMTGGDEPPTKRRKSGPRYESSQSPSRIKVNRLREERQGLPIYPARSRLVQEVRKHESVIVIGETGSGKTTQIPQYLLECGVHQGKVIAVTQGEVRLAMGLLLTRFKCDLRPTSTPRRVAAMTVSQRVAQEKNCELGRLVGYCVRFDDMTTEQTKIKYMTDGMLLREAILDPLMTRYSVVILDEAHERTIHTDVLFGVVKAAQKDRKKKGMKVLKIIVMSATMDVDHFSSYFNQAPVLYLEGRQFPVQVLYCCESQSDYLFACLVTLFQIHREHPPGEDVLIFLTGQEEIESAVQSIRDIARDMAGEAPPLDVYPLYAALPTQQQIKVFTPTQKGHRKVIVSTNIAETSVTIHGIKFVIDCGRVKAKVFNPGSGLDLLRVVRVSKSQALQRTGRAGREAPGSCYRIYTEEDFDKMKINTVPEIQRCNLSSVVLQMLALGISDIPNFDFMDKPSIESIINALDSLILLGAVEKKEKIQLTPIGKKMASFPLEPRLSKILLLAREHHCLEEILTIVSLLSVDSILFTPHSKREAAIAARRKFISSDGDSITLLNIYRAYKGVGGNKEWCRENFINMRNVKTALEVRKQLRDITQRLELPLQSCGQDTATIRRCLAAGFFMNAAELQKTGDYITLSTRKPVSIHPSSALFQSKPAYVIYNELVQTSKCYMRDVSVVDPEWLSEAAPALFKKPSAAAVT